VNGQRINTRSARLHGSLVLRKKENALLSQNGRRARGSDVHREYAEIEKTIAETNIELQ
jgi:hypothetical protein